MLTNSKTLQEMLTAKQGYCLKECSREMIGDVSDVIYGELISGNIEMVPYMQERGLLTTFLPEGMNDNDFYYMCIENAISISEELVDWLSFQLNTEHMSALWLTSLEAAKAIYAGRDVKIEKFTIPEDFIVISDLDEAGALFVIGEMHERLKCS